MIRAVVVALLAGTSAGCIAALAAGGRRSVRARLGIDTPPTPRRDRRVPPALAMRAGLAVPAWLVGDALGGVMVGAAMTGLSVASPSLVRRRRASRQTVLLREQLADAVDVIASGLRSGRSLVQAVAIAGDEIPKPLGPSLRRVADRLALGDRLEDALDVWVADVGGPDARLAAGVLRLHRRTGGALSVALDNLVSTLRARRGAARELRSLTAQARLSATILGLLPIGFFLFMSVVARNDLETALATPVGSTAVVLGFGLQACAYLWIKGLLRVET